MGRHAAALHSHQYGNLSSTASSGNHVVDDIYAALLATGPSLYLPPPQFVTPQVGAAMPAPIGRPPAKPVNGGSLMQQLVTERKTRVKDYMSTHGQTLLQQQGTPGAECTCALCRAEDWPGLDALPESMLAESLWDEARSPWNAENTIGDGAGIGWRRPSVPSSSSSFLQQLRDTPSPRANGECH